MKNILLIEDDETLRENTAELLEISGNYNITTAANGKIGIEKALNTTPDLIICDIMMPEVNGYEVLKKLSQHSNTKYIPFIFLSAMTERGDVRKGMDLGADDYITKPFTEDELISAIKSRLAKSIILKEKREEVLEKKNELRNLNDVKIFFDDNGQTFLYKNKDIIYHQGDNSNYVFLIIKGTVKCSKLNEQGKNLTTSLYKEDDLFGYTSFNNNVAYKETATAISNVELVGIPKTAFKNILKENHKVVLEMIDLLSGNIDTIKNQLLDMAYNSVHKKTADTILKFSEKINRNPEDPIKISRFDLASVAGIATETLIRSLAKLKNDGIIAIEGRNIKVINLNALKLIE